MSWACPYTLEFPPVFYKWLERARRYPMFDIVREGTLCSVRLLYLLEPQGGPRDIFLHKQRLAATLPHSYLPLGYDAFWNILVWDVAGGGVYFQWRGRSSSPLLLVAPSLESFCDQLYYRPWNA
ncbi:MAG: hypothetical protein ABDH91_02470 [Bacteroidia bacterium]